jgi:hypothetical protein
MILLHYTIFRVIEVLELSNSDCTFLSALKIPVDDCRKQRILKQTD